jgi:DNA-binding MarR family transcriptional regulator
VYASNVEEFRNRKIRMSKEIPPRMRRDELVELVGQEIYEFQNAADAVDDAVAAILGLNPTDQRCLGVLVLRGTMTAGRLAEHASVSPGAMTASLDRLERTGYVRRLRDDEDRRRVLVEATPEAREAAWSLYRPLAEEGARRLSGYTNEQLRSIVQFLRAGSELQIEYAGRLRVVAARRRGSIGAAVRKAAERLQAVRWEAKAIARDVKAEAKALAKEVADEVKSDLKAQADTAGGELNVQVRAIRDDLRAELERPGDDT